MSEYETVYSIYEFYDGIRSGIADFNNRPHHFQCPFDENTQDYADYFFLTPIDAETFQLARESNEIWKRWYLACQAGQTTYKTHPALPEDRLRHNEIKELLKKRLVVNPQKATQAMADFNRDYTGIHPQHSTNPMAKIWVKWSVIT